MLAPIRDFHSSVSLVVNHIEPDLGLDNPPLLVCDLVQ